MNNSLRKQETRRKIELGGLVIKAGLSNESSDVILGALLKAATTLELAEGNRVRNEFKALGEAAFRAGSSIID